MTRFVLTYLFFILVFTAHAQTDWHCATPHTDMPSDLKALRSSKEASGFSRNLNPYNATILPVTFHIVQNNIGSGGLPSSQVAQVLNILNASYAAANIQFEQCGTINYINNSSLFNFDVDNMPYLASNFNVANTVNIYFVNALYANGSSGLNGISSFPWQNNHLVVIDNNNAATSVIAHELGHYLGLYHTHENIFGYEWVNGGNCQVAGDMICDTPADPNLAGNTVNCVYVGYYIDPLGWYYQPDIYNYMSYNSPWCLQHFSTQQIYWMNNTIDNYYSNYSCGSGGGGNGDLITLYSPIYINPNPIECNSSIAVNVDVVNSGNSTFYGDFAAVLFDINSNFTEIAIINTGSDGLPAGYHYTGGITFEGGGFNLNPGTYSLSIFYIPDGDVPYLAANGYYENNIPVQVQCGGGGTPAYICSYSNLQIAPNPLISYQPVQVSYQVGNTGQQPFLGTFSADFHDMNGAWLGAIEVHNNISICGGCTQVMTFSANNLALSPGSYQIVAWQQTNGQSWSIVDGCNIYNSSITVNVLSSGGSTSADDVSEDEIQVLAYPNPAQSSINLSLKNSKQAIDQVLIYNSSGQLIYENKTVPSSLRIDLTNWDSGIYFYNIQLNDEYLHGRFSVIK